MTLCTSLSYANECAECHAEIKVDHFKASCTDCHAKNEKKHFSRAADFKSSASGCMQCHSEYESMLTSKMHTRADEKKSWAAETFKKYDNKFFDKNCSGCHVSSCSDCHGVHNISKPQTDTCLTCHNNHATGVDYTGYAPRPQADKYQRGKVIDDKHYLKMLPDIHFEKGTSCADCHSMKSLAKGESSSKSCVSCHKPDNKIPEHNNHGRLECETCHSAWGYSELGTYYLKFDNSQKRYQQFASRLEPVSSEVVKSAVLHEYQAPVMGVNDEGRISAIRPFITLISQWKGNEVVVENKIVSKSWGAYSPHTTRRGVRGCESCHDNDKRLMNMTKEDDTLDLRRDGIDMDTFWNKQGQEVYNGRFLTDAEIKNNQNKKPIYIRN